MVVHNTEQMVVEVEVEVDFVVLVLAQTLVVVHLLKVNKQFLLVHTQ